MSTKIKTENAILVPAGTLKKSPALLSAEELLTDINVWLFDEFGIDVNLFIHQVNERLFKKTFDPESDLFVKEILNWIQLLPPHMSYTDPAGGFTEVLPLYPV